MPSFEELMQSTLQKGEIRGAVVAASNASGSFSYIEAFGSSSPSGPPDAHPMPKDAVMWIASCSKLATTIAAMQCVERGLLKLDGDAGEVLPELRGLKLLEGFEEVGEDGKEKPKLGEVEGPITLRQLLTHTSGLTYPLFYPPLAKCQNLIAPEDNQAPTVIPRYLTPLVFQPGKSWMYGSGIDFVGLMVSRVNDNMGLEAYMKQHIFAPLGIKDLTFFPETHPDIQARVLELVSRRPDGSYGPNIEPIGNSGIKEEFGGQGLSGTMGEYLKIMRSLLGDEKLLKRGTIDTMFKPAIDEVCTKAYMDAQAVPLELVHNVFGLRTDAKLPKTWGLGGVLIMESVPGWRNKGTMVWSGLPNLQWFIDPEAGLCGIYGSQLLPTGDTASYKCMRAFEEAMLERCKAHAK